MLNALKQISKVLVIMFLQKTNLKWCRLTFSVNFYLSLFINFSQMIFILHLIIIWLPFSWCHIRIFVRIFQIFIEVLNVAGISRIWKWNWIYRVSVKWRRHFRRFEKMISYNGGKIWPKINSSLDILPFVTTLLGTHLELFGLSLIDMIIYMILNKIGSKNINKLYPERYLYQKCI